VRETRERKTTANVLEDSPQKITHVRETREGKTPANVLEESDVGRNVNDVVGALLCKALQAGEEMPVCGRLDEKVRMGSVQIEARRPVLQKEEKQIRPSPTRARCEVGGQGCTRHCAYMRGGGTEMYQTLRVHDGHDRILNREDGVLWNSERIRRDAHHAAQGPGREKDEILLMTVGGPQLPIWRNGTVRGGVNEEVDHVLERDGIYATEMRGRVLPEHDESCLKQKARVDESCVGDAKNGVIVGAT